MKIYKTLEAGNAQYYSNFKEAKKNAKEAYEDYLQSDNGTSDSEVEIVIIPTTKKGLIEWLNQNAYYTGHSVD